MKQKQEPGKGQPGVDPGLVKGVKEQHQAIWLEIFGRVITAEEAFNRVSKLLGFLRSEGQSMNKVDDAHLAASQRLKASQEKPNLPAKESQASYTKLGSGQHTDSQEGQQ